MVPQPWGATAKKKGRGSRGQSRNSPRETEQGKEGGSETQGYPTSQSGP